jgi:hypothetical protein
VALIRSFRPGEAVEQFEAHLALHAGGRLAALGY